MGGDATYELSVGLKNNTAIAGQYQLQYTAYVDGIRHNLLSAERRLPVNTKYHDNVYQRKDWLLKGDSVTGANNVNVTNTTWGKNLVHTTIDDNLTLQNTLVNNLMTRVIARETNRASPLAREEVVQFFQRISQVGRNCRVDCATHTFVSR